MKKRKVIVFGSIHMDIISRVENLPRPGETLQGISWKLRAGGKGRNQAISASMHQSKVIMFGCVGNDEFSDYLLNSFSQTTVDYSNIKKITNMRSGTSIAILDNRGNSESIVISGVNKNIPDELILSFKSQIEKNDIVILQNEIQPKMNEKIIEISSKKHAFIIYNAAPYYPLSKNILQEIDILIINEVEAEDFSGIKVKSIEEAKEAIKTLQQKFIKATIIITLGSNGVVFKIKNDRITHIPPFQVNTTDAHGAGDAFTGALAGYIAKEQDLKKAVHYANATAALTIQKTYEQRNNIKIPEILKLLQLSNQNEL